MPLFKFDNDVILKGTYQIPFSFVLPVDLPMSFYMERPVSLIKNTFFKAAL